jgi:predicted ATPase
VVSGEAGIGKTTLLQAAEKLAGGFTCLWARGVESEAALGHAALLELLGPVRDRLADLPAAQAEALAALGWGPAGASGDRYLVAAATLSLLAATAQPAPVLVLVDDLQWVDRESAAALLFAARRLHHDAVAFLFAVRTGPRPPTSLEGLPVLALAGLAPRQAAELLSDGMADPVVARLVERTRGNPLALTEVASRLTPGAAPSRTSCRWATDWSWCVRAAADRAVGPGMASHRAVRRQPRGGQRPAGQCPAPGRRGPGHRPGTRPRSAGC